MTDRFGKWLLAILIALIAGIYLLGNARVQLWDRDEPRYAQTSRQMLQSGDWVVPHLLDEVRTAKPVFIYWCQAAAMSVLGDNAFAARLPSVIAMLLTLIVLAVVIWRTIGAEHALWTTIVLGTSGLVIAWAARNALTDGVLLLWIVIAQLCLLHVYETRRASWLTVVIWSIAIGLAGLTKGPVIFAFQGMTLIALWAMHLWDRWSLSRHRQRQLQPALTGASITTHAESRHSERSDQSHHVQTPEILRNAQDDLSSNSRFAVSSISIAKFIVGILIVAAVVGPWLWLLQHRAPEFLKTTVEHDVIDRTFQPLEQHTGPPGYYLLTIWGTFFPWCLFLPMAMIFGWRHRGNPRIRFAWAAVVGPWIFFELVRTKLPHYLLPCFPALAFLTADALVRCFRREEDDIVRPTFLISAAIWSIVVLVLGFIPWLAFGKLSPIPLGATIAWSLVAIAYAVTVFALFVAEKPLHAARAMAGGMVAAIIVAFGFYLPNAWFFRLSSSVANVLKHDGATLPGQEQMIAYKEPSLAFYQGGTIREQPENDFLITHPPSQWPKWLTIRSDVWDHMPASVKDHLTVLSTCRGWAYTDRGRMEQVVVVKKKSKTESAHGI